MLLNKLFSLSEVDGHFDEGCEDLDSEKGQRRGKKRTKIGLGGYKENLNGKDPLEVRKILSGAK